MQKIKEENGITLAILVVTVIVLLILVGVTIDKGFNSVDSSKNTNKKSELQIVGQATITEYTKAQQLNDLVDKKVNEYGEEVLNPIPENFVGTVITNQGSDLMPALPYGSWALTPNEAVGYKSYFRLTPEKLEELYITNTTDTYIINYYTGEVFNETKKIADDDTVLYLRLNNSTATSKETDTSSFVD